MERKIYISDNTVALCGYIPDIDDPESYENWQDPETQKGYNFVSRKSYEEYRKEPESRFLATIIRVSDGARIGSIFLSPGGTEPDLAIIVYKPYRNQGYGTAAFSLGATYCFETFGFDFIYAGCYPWNVGSRKMLEKCGFVRHPEGDLRKKHYLTGEDITQYDFVLERSERSNMNVYIEG